MRKKVSFYDEYNNYCTAVADINNSLVRIEAYDGMFENMGHIELMVDDRIFLNEIICKPEYRRLGVGSSLIDIFEYLYKDYTGIVYGIYSPCDLALNVKENDIIGKGFYEKNGYKVVSRREFLDNKDLYPGLKIDDFIEAKRVFDYSLIYKQNIQKDDYYFVERHGEIFEDNEKKLVKQMKI